MDGQALSIGELAEKTGVPQATLRTWESRFGVPRPIRLPSGQRRYSLDDVTFIQTVVGLRESGLTMPMAIAQAASDAALSEPSLFRALRSSHPELAVSAMSKTTLLALTRAVEDECCAQARQPILFAAFQEQRHFRRSASRWNDFARTSRSCVVFADFTRKQRPAQGQPLRIHLPPESPLRREWLLVCDSADLPACVAGWELPGQEGVAEGLRRFETVWSLDARVVRRAAQVCAGLASTLSTGLPDPLSAVAPPTRPSPDLARGEQLFQRIVDYLDTSIANSTQ